MRQNPKSNCPPPFDRPGCLERGGALPPRGSAAPPWAGGAALEGGASDPAEACAVGVEAGGAGEAAGPAVIASSLAFDEAASCAAKLDAVAGGPLPCTRSATRAPAPR